MQAPPPMFSPPQVDLKPQQYLHRARIFRNATLGLTAYVNGEQNWPAYALLLHACELALKAFCGQAVADGKPSERAPNHDLQGWYQIALKYGLPADPEVAAGIEIQTEIHSDHQTRYPDNQRRVPDIWSAANEVADRLIAAATPSVNPR